jgi:DNA repair ATPase RecN
MPEFFKTVMGHKFYEADIPRLTSVLEKIANQLQSLNEREEKKWRLDEKLKRIELKDKLNEANRTKG